MTTALAFFDTFLLRMVRLRNKSGLDRDSAKRVFDEYHARKDQDPPDSDDPKVVMKRVLDFMQTTSRKLDKLDEDITDLRRQVDSILKRL